MRLDDWMTLEGVTELDLRARMIWAAPLVLGDTVQPFAPAQQTVNQAKKHLVIPRADFLRVLYAVAAGQVEPNDFHDLPEKVAEKLGEPGFWDKEPVRMALAVVRSNL